ncbi:MAG: hypothetical protein OXB95_04665 [Rhodobacteraceae bacterium]|nr:hypothetical protein [Paracoccaceae bacterium]
MRKPTAARYALDATSPSTLWRLESPVAGCRLQVVLDQAAIMACHKGILSLEAMAEG